MLRYLIDPANGITMVGLALSSLGLCFTIQGQPELGVAVVLWATIADHLDGIVARRTVDRPAEFGSMGKSLDGFADLTYGAIFPAIVLTQVSGASSLSMLTASALLLAGALRLSYFANFGLSSDGCFKGVPLSYDVPLLAVFFLLRPTLPQADFSTYICVAFLLLAALHVASLRVPRTSGPMLVLIILFSVASSAIFLLR